LGDIQLGLTEPISKDRRSTDPDTAEERSINTGKLKRSPQLQKVVWGLASCVRLNLSRRRVELEEVLVHVLTDFKNGSHVTTAVTIVRRTEDCDNILILHEL
jgi:hypothetical protein